MSRTYGPGTSNKSLAAAIEEMLRTDGFTSKQIEIMQEAAERIGELPDEEED